MHTPVTKQSSKVGLVPERFLPQNKWYTLCVCVCVSARVRVCVREAEFDSNEK